MVLFFRLGRLLYFLEDSISFLNKKIYKDEPITTTINFTIMYEFALMNVSCTSKTTKTSDDKNAKNIKKKVFTDADLFFINTTFFLNSLDSNITIA